VPWRPHDLPASSFLRVVPSSQQKQPYPNPPGKPVHTMPGLFCVPPERPSQESVHKSLSISYGCCCRCLLFCRCLFFVVILSHTGVPGERALCACWGGSAKDPRILHDATGANAAHQPSTFVWAPPSGCATTMRGPSATLQDDDEKQTTTHHLTQQLLRSAPTSKRADTEVSALPTVSCSYCCTASISSSILT
jgi:hypothetical protein